MKPCEMSGCAAVLTCSRVVFERRMRKLFECVCVVVQSRMYS